MSVFDPYAGVVSFSAIACDTTQIYASSKPKTQFQLRLESELHQRVRAEAERRGVSANKVFNQLIAEALDKSALARRVDEMENNIIRAIQKEAE